MSDRTLFTSESVTEGHPDKIADQISDGVLDAILAQDPMARVACETLLTTGLCVVAGEITTSAVIDITSIARKTIVDIGYDDSAKVARCLFHSTNRVPKSAAASTRPSNIARARAAKTN